MIEYAGGGMVKKRKPHITLMKSATSSNPMWICRFRKMLVGIGLTPQDAYKAWVEANVNVIFQRVPDIDSRPPERLA